MEGEWSLSRLLPLLPGAAAPSTHFTESWGSSGKGWMITRTEKHRVVNIGIIRRLATLQSSRYTDCAACQVI